MAAAARRPPHRSGLGRPKSYSKRFITELSPTTTRRGPVYSGRSSSRPRSSSSRGCADLLVQLDRFEGATRLSRVVLPLGLHVSLHVCGPTPVARSGLADAAARPPRPRASPSSPAAGEPRPEAVSREGSTSHTLGGRRPSPRQILGCASGVFRGPWVIRIVCRPDAQKRRSVRARARLARAAVGACSSPSTSRVMSKPSIRATSSRGSSPRWG